MKIQIDDVPIEAQDLIRNYEKKINSITDGFSDTITKQRVPETIYHYTDDRGLEGIIKCGTLWFTDIFDLNDPSELKHGIALAIDVLMEETKRKEHLKTFAQTFSNRFSESIERTANYFVCCFSKNGDELGQWRAYADDGRGYALGFDAEVLERLFGGESASFPVIYNDDDLRSLYRVIVRQVVPLLNGLHGLKLRPDVYQKCLFYTSVLLSSNFIINSIHFKNESYKNEEEYRFIHFYSGIKPVPGLKLRTRPYSLVRYIESDWRTSASDALKEIVCGPASDPDRGAKFARDCLRTYCPGMDVTIDGSRIPYRSARTLG